MALTEQCGSLTHWSDRPGLTSTLVGTAGQTSELVGTASQTSELVGTAGQTSLNKHMTIPATIQTFHFASNTVQLYVPSAEWLQQQFEKTDENASAPYWAQIWPAAKALCEVIAAQPQLVTNKKVLEIAAGLGLPSLLTAQFAKEVTASDYIEDAVKMIQRSAEYNGIKNIQCCVMDWNKPDKKIQPDVLLVSDINYDPKSFDTLYRVLTAYIQQGTTVLLSTPQRLVAKSFMNRLQPWCRQTHHIEIKHNKEAILTSVWLLEK